MRTGGLWVCLLLCLLVFADCGFRPWKRGEQDRRTEAEDQFDPLGFPRDRVIVTEEEPPGRSAKTPERNRHNDSASEESAGTEEVSSLKVHRDQFFATKYPDEAKQVAELVEHELSEQTYIEYKAPYYWVRAGDCQTQDQADSLLRKIKDLGYTESWVVEVKIEP
jgi:hypothetical protein